MGSQYLAAPFHLESSTTSHFVCLRVFSNPEGFNFLEFQRFNDQDGRFLQIPRGRDVELHPLELQLARGGGPTGAPEAESCGTRSNGRARIESLERPAGVG